MDFDGFFEEHDRSREIFEAIAQTVRRIGPAEIRISKSQIAFQRRHGFAFVWIPGKYLRGMTTPLVLTIVLHRRDTSPRWKQIVEPYPGRFIHHLELHEVEQITEEIHAILIEAWNLAS